MEEVELIKKRQRVESEIYSSIIIISAIKNDDARIRSLALRTIDILPKLFNRTEVVVRITNMLRVQPVLQPL
jgi:DNA-binding response OmpR family regulator